MEADAGSHADAAGHRAAVEAREPCLAGREAEGAAGAGITWAPAEGEAAASAEDQAVVEAAVRLSDSAKSPAV